MFDTANWARDVTMGAVGSSSGVRGLFGKATGSGAGRAARGWGYMARDSHFMRGAGVGAGGMLGYSMYRNHRNRQRYG